MIKVTDRAQRIRLGEPAEIVEHTEEFTSELDALVYLGQGLSNAGKGRLFRTLSMTIHIAEPLDTDPTV